MMAISVLNFSQKKRASTAASRDGGRAVGMLIVDLRASLGFARACSYATRNFSAQVRQPNGLVLTAGTTSPPRLAAPIPL
jgi:hypothetical protein